MLQQSTFSAYDGRVPEHNHHRLPLATKTFQNTTLLFCVLVTVWTAVLPVCRAFLQGEVSYNEGWNIYAAERVVHHQPLYPPAYQLTTVNYPMLSFFLMAGLHKFTHEYLFTARVVSLLSLLVCGFLVAACVRLLGGTIRSASLAGLLCVAVFCAALNDYVGVDDPQILANAVFLFGFTLYLYRRRSMPVLAVSAFTFAVAISIKHSPVEFVLAVLIDLAIASLPLAVWFATSGLAFGALSFVLHIRYGGPGFMMQLLAPRAYTASAIVDRLRDALGPLLVPFMLALLVAYSVRSNPQQRILPILMTTSVLVGCYFAGGHGVSVNCLFGAVFTTCMLVGLLWDCSSPVLRSAVVQMHAPPVLFLWLLIPMALNKDLNSVAALRAAEEDSRNFSREAELIYERPGPAVCESLLVCYEAGKPFVYDPFNATRLIAADKLDPNPLLNQIRDRTISTIQFETTVDQAEMYERISPNFAAAVHDSYQPLNAHLTKGMIFVPKHIDTVSELHP